MARLWPKKPFPLAHCRPDFLPETSYPRVVLMCLKVGLSFSEYLCARLLRRWSLSSAAKASAKNPCTIFLSYCNIGLMNLFPHKVMYRSALLIACVLAVLGLAVAHPGVAHAASSPPATNLGIWTSAEDSGSYSTVSGQSPDVANYYLDWGTSYPQSFFSPAQSAGATAFLEIEPWISSQGTDTCSGSGPTMTTIGANGSAIQSYAKSIGSAIASAGKPVIVTFAHEFNVSGQYPWAQGDCEGTTASQW